MVVFGSLEIDRVEFEKGPFEGMLHRILFSMNLMNLDHASPS